MTLIEQIENSPEFIKFRREFPIKANLRLTHYKKEWKLFADNYALYKGYQTAVKTSNETTQGWGDGKIAGSIPAIIVDWLTWRAQLRGDKLTNKELYGYLKAHPEWLCVDRSKT